MNIGQFEIHDSFRIANRGIALAGKVITDGNDIPINIGDNISFSYNNEKITRKITGIEIGFGRYYGNKYSHLQNLGILIECENEAEIESLKTWKPEKVLAELIATD